MEAVSLVLWAAALADGTLLVALWLALGGRNEPEAEAEERPDRNADERTESVRVFPQRPTRGITAHLVVTHAVLALVGFVLWLAVSGNPTYQNRDAGWFVILMVVVTAVWGVAMFARWRQGRAWSKREGYAAWAEHKLPTAAVLGHGIFGLGAVVLTVLAVVR